MAEKPLAGKLQIKAGHHVLGVNWPEGFAEKLGTLPEWAEVAHRGKGPFDVVLLFAKDQAEASRLAPAAMKAAKALGVLWIAYPKKASHVKTDLTRDRGWDVMKQAAWRPVSQVAIDEVWSALRFRPQADVGR